MTQPPAGDGGLATTTCRVCSSEVPAADYCGACGAELSEPATARGRLRWETYAAAPDEQVIRLSVTSSLFPHLPPRSRPAFRLGLAVVLLLLITLGLLRWQAPMIAVGAVGLPAIFVLYLYETNVHRDVTVRVLASTGLVGIALGAGWALATGPLVADFYDVSVADTASRRVAALVGIGVPIGGAILMLVPVMVVRFIRPRRNALDGFVIGALGAIGFTAAATLVLMAPQFATGVVAADRPASVLLVQAGVQGVAAPLTAAAMGGLVGAALWLGRRWFVVVSVLVTVAVYAAIGVAEVTPILEGLHFGAHLMIAVVAVLALRIGLQYCLLTEDRESRASRTAPVHRTTRGWLFMTLTAGLGVAVAAGLTASVLATPPHPRYTCPPDCGRPPIGEPVELNPRFVSQDGEFSVQYPAPGALYRATLYRDWVSLEYLGGDTGTLDLWGEPAVRRTAKQVVDDMMAQYYPDATRDYEIPNAMVGYEPGYGAVYDQYPQDSSGRFTRLRLVVLSAVKNDYALVASAVGPFHEFTPDFGTGHPSGANLALALDMGKYVNSFRWRNEPSA